MFGIGFPELILILVVALVVFGPKQLPEVARSIGRGIREIKKATADITDLTDLDSSSQDRARISPNPANPNREAVAPLIKPENEAGEIIEEKSTAPKTELVESTVADAKELQVDMMEKKIVDVESTSSEEQATDMVKNNK